MKFLWLMVLAIAAWRLIAGRWPWQAGAKALRKRSRERARTLLGVPPGASKQDIVDAHRRVFARVHPDRGGSNDAVHEANAARDILLEELPEYPQEQI